MCWERTSPFIGNPEKKWILPTPRNFLKDLLRWIKINSDSWPAPNKVIWIPRLSPSFYLDLNLRQELAKKIKSVSWLTTAFDIRSRDVPQEQVSKYTLLNPNSKLWAGAKRIGNPGGPTYSEKRMRQGFLLKNVPHRSNKTEESSSKIDQLSYLIKLFTRADRISENVTNSRRLMVIGAWIAALVMASPQAIIFRWPSQK